MVGGCASVVRGLLLLSGSSLFIQPLRAGPGSQPASQVARLWKDCQCPLFCLFLPGLPADSSFSSPSSASCCCCLPAASSLYSTVESWEEAPLLAASGHTQGKLAGIRPGGAATLLLLLLLLLPRYATTRLSE